MATGVEAGLLIGTFSLLIALLENCENVSRPVGDFIHWRERQGVLITELKNLRISYEHVISYLLKPVVGPDELEAMVKDPSSDLWTSGSIAERLREKLGVIYSPVRTSNEEIAEILQDIASRLNIKSSQGVQIHTFETDRPLEASESGPATADTQPRKKKFEFRRRTLFAIKKKHIKMSLKRLKELTNRIDEWVQRAERTRDTVASHTSVSFIDTPEAIQDNATRIYMAYIRTTARKLSFDGECYKDIIDRVDIEFRTVQKLSSSNVQVEPPTAHVPAPHDDPSLPSLITDICQYIRQPTYPSFGFCLDGAGGLRVYPSSSAITQSTDQCQTLESILPRLQIRLPLEEVYSLAITIVASVFQLSHTPWLRRRWGKKDIAFLKASKKPHLPVDIQYPYLTRAFSIVGDQSDAKIASDRSSLLRLGILLLEIGFGESIEEVRHPDDLGNNSVADDEADRQTADRWFKDKSTCLLPAFRQAILTCLQEYLNPGANLNDPDYSNFIKKKVLLPLEDERLSMAFGVPG
ncbi:hypothetical protein P170DRAFT_460138 [Aspergillus steynii IBT 23096]|uniref:DUF7580 domain-containing protein n=1 Tax=Aspergillus steynii IBT 23096 TaxID=1392250 RepID=A0A2I2GLN0_9EURO|nr:uncharacterized protein P170DRAFT_460138 [Aspergillus steynii IBT 23096]PLB53782.1 hypothetical protein P170DRAFT_460138 [Aspergillus steynii IBT 23096]